MTKKYPSLTALAVMLSVSCLSACTMSSPSQGNLDAFAQCIAEKKLTMYGAAWCSHCKKEKLNFGTSFQYIPYVECPENTQACLDRGVNGYPTWIAQDGQKYEGEQGLQKLSQISGCVLSK